MKKLLKKILAKSGFALIKINGFDNAVNRPFARIYSKYKAYTMTPEPVYISNLKLCANAANIPGDIVECGVWKGGMSAGIAEVLGNKRMYYLFDSFEGLPPAKDIDGDAARAWQQDDTNEAYYNNCAAAESEAIEAMQLANVKFKTVKGWFNQTLPNFKLMHPIAILRLDGDWYDSTMDCLKYLYPKVNHGGIVILDDYYAWDGCSRAVHDYLSATGSVSRIYTTAEDVAYIIKKDEYAG